MLNNGHLLIVVWKWKEKLFYWTSARTRPTARYSSIADRLKINRLIGGWCNQRHRALWYITTAFQFLLQAFEIFEKIIDCFGPCNHDPGIRYNEVTAGTWYR